MGRYEHWRTDDSTSSCFRDILNVGKMRGVTPTDAIASNTFSYRAEIVLSEYKKQVVFLPLHAFFILKNKKNKQSKIFFLIFFYAQNTVMCF